jgi:dihydrolipoamide dehydrogenase
MRALRHLRRSFASYDYDVAIIGGGPGGYVAAIKAAQLGLKTACIDKRGALGGTCLNVGCIPAKALLNSSYKYYEALHHLKSHGITASDVKVDLAQMMQGKQKSVTGLTKGVEGLLKKNGVAYLKGTASFDSPNTIKVDGGSPISAKNIVIASGSVPSQVPGGFLPIDEQRVLSSTGAMELQQIPKSMAVIGAGVIGLELGSVYSRLGTDVKIIEFLPRISPGVDLETATQLQKILEKQGLKFHLGAKVVAGEKKSNSVVLSLEAGQGGKDVPSTIEAEYVLVAVGRSSYTEGLNLKQVGITTDNRGRIEVNEHLQTTKHSHIYAIGDCTVGPMLAHKAEEEGVFVAEQLAGRGGHINYAAMPWVIYTHPEVAWVGKTEEQLKAENIAYKKGVFPFLANSRARTNQVGAM